jgi:hypothetical protein
MKTIQPILGADERKAEEVEEGEARLSVVFDVTSPWQKAVGLEIVWLPYMHSLHWPTVRECSQYSQH